MHTLPSSFLFPTIIYHCQIYQLQSNNVRRKGKMKSKKRPGKAHIFNKPEYLPSVQKSKRQQPGRTPTGRQTNKKATQLRNSLLQFFDNNLFGGQKKKFPETDQPLFF